MSAIADIEPTLIDVTPPIKIDAGGTARIGGTRVTLDTFVDAFNAGCEAEELVLRFPSISLPDAYAAIAYFLSHKSAVESYLAIRAEKAAININRVEADFGKSALRAKLLNMRGVK